MAKLKIINDEKYKKVVFDVIQIGSVFVYEGKCYLKNAATTAVDLTLGLTNKFEPDDLVTFVDKAELRLYY